MKHNSGEKISQKNEPKAEKRQKKKSDKTRPKNKQADSFQRHVFLRLRDSVDLFPVGGASISSNIKFEKNFLRFEKEVFQFFQGHVRW